MQFEIRHGLRLNSRGAVLSAGFFLKGRSPLSESILRSG
jgi:hypothetical protein